MTQTLYLDMDGVVADFDGYAKQVLGLPPSGGTYPDHIWKQLALNHRLYRDLSPTPYAHTLVDFCKDLCQRQGWDLLFLTAVPKGNDMPWAFYDKVIWAQDFFPDIPVHFGPYSHDKHYHCRPGDILIDDRTSNCEEWRSAGGIAIQHLGDIDKTLQYLREL